MGAEALLERMTSIVEAARALASLGPNSTSDSRDFLLHSRAVSEDLDFNRWDYGKYKLDIFNLPRLLCASLF